MFELGCGLQGLVSTEPAAASPIPGWLNPRQVPSGRLSNNELLSISGVSTYRLALT
jgi:hypothetical protein